MDKIYGEDAFITPQQMVAESDEARLIEYLRKVGTGELWIYTESARIEDACAKAYEVLTAKNREIMLLRQDMAALRDSMKDRCAEIVDLQLKLKAKKRIRSTKAESGE